MFFPSYLQIDDITRYSKGNKNYHIVNSCQRFSLSGKVCDGNLFQNG